MFFSELIRNHTLKFLSKALPALTSDSASIPKVTEVLTPSFETSFDTKNNRLERYKRDVNKISNQPDERTTKDRKFCEEGGM